jgi:hypothetical protein
MLEGVWIVVECYYNFCENWESIYRVCSSEAIANDLRETAEIECTADRTTYYISYHKVC